MSATQTHASWSMAQACTYCISGQWYICSLQWRGECERLLRMVAAGQLRVCERLHGPLRHILRGLQRWTEAVPQELCPLVQRVPQEIGVRAYPIVLFQTRTQSFQMRPTSIPSCDGAVCEIKLPQHLYEFNNRCFYNLLLWWFSNIIKISL